MKALIIYDNSGTIHAINYGETKTPTGLRAIIAEVPENVQTIDRMDGDRPVFTYLPQAQQTAYDQMSQTAAAKAEELRKSLEDLIAVVSEDLSDAQALRVSSLFPEWNADGASYSKDQKVVRNGELYRVLTAHTSQSNWTPEHSPSLFVKVIDVNLTNPGALLEWLQPESTNPYKKGDQVVYNGITYESLVSGNVWRPGDVGTESLWKVVS